MYPLAQLFQRPHVHVSLARGDRQPYLAVCAHNSRMGRGSLPGPVCEGEHYDWRIAGSCLTWAILMITAEMRAGVRGRGGGRLRDGGKEQRKDAGW